MESDPRANDRRIARRQRAFAPGAVCLVCGVDDPDLFCMHHLGGVCNDAELEWPHCANCHRKAHVLSSRVGVADSHEPRTVPEKIEAVLRGLAEFFRLLAERLHEWATYLARLVEALDKRDPSWRDMPEAWT